MKDMQSKKTPVAERTQSASPSPGVNDIYIDPALEKRVMSKFDKYVLPQMSLLIILAYLDRSNIGMVSLTCLPTR
jgi:hypothetical protein